MTLNGVEYYRGHGDSMVPQHPKGTVFQLLHDDSHPRMPGCRNMKKGKYVILRIDQSLLGKDLVYVIRSNRSSATYEWRWDHVVIDKAIAAGAIHVDPLRSPQ